MSQEKHSPVNIAERKQSGCRTLMTLKTTMSPDEPTSKGLICNKSEYLER